MMDTNKARTVLREKSSSLGKRRPSPTPPARKPLRKRNPCPGALPLTMEEL